MTLTLETNPPTPRDPIYLGTMLQLFASRIHDFQHLLARPKSVPSSIVTTFGSIEPLGFERFRICELYAELLHCSNMALLNDERGEEVVRERDVERERLRKQGLSRPQKTDIWGDAVLQNGSNSAPRSESSEESDDEDRNLVSEVVEKPMENIEPNEGSTKNPDAQGADSTSQHVEPSSEAQEKNCDESNVAPLDSLVRQQNLEESIVIEAKDAVSTAMTADSEENHVDIQPRLPIFHEGQNRPVVGDYLKMQFVEARVLPSVVDLFFAHPWNNFLHNVVYDILTQVLNGPMDRGFNRQLAIDLFTTGQLTEKIIEGQKASDDAQ